MKSLLFTLGLALCCFLQANGDVPFEKFEHSKINGPWYIGVIITNCQKMKEVLLYMPATPVNFNQLSPDEVQMTMDMKTPNGCKTIKPLLKRENGVFSTTCGKDGKKTVNTIDMKDKAMYTLVTFTKKKGSCKVATLAVKDMDDIQKYLKDFEAFAARYGLQDEKPYTLSKNDMCERSS